MPHTRPIYALKPDEVFAALRSSKEGLSAREGAARLRRHGPNELPEPKGRPLILRFLDELTHFMAILLWVAGVLAFVSRTPELGWAIWAVVLINGAFSFWQEYKAERALKELKKVLPAQARVMRDGELQMVEAKRLVPGDLVLLEEGDRVSADLRLVVAEGVAVDVSVLTGESLPVSKHHHPLKADRHRTPEIPNIVHAGATVTTGRGSGVVFATGVATEFGKVAHLTATVERGESTLAQQVRRLVRIITMIAVAMGVAVFFLASLLVGMETRESFIFAIGIIVAFVPEGLLPTVTLALAIGVQRMARKKALVRRLSAVETLSAVDVICTDKTGTLTENQMTVRALWTPAGMVEVTGTGYHLDGKVAFPAEPRAAGQVQLLLAGAALCCDARLGPAEEPGSFKVIGDPTEGALLVASHKGGVDLETLRKQSPRVRELAFDSRRKMMSVAHTWQSCELWPTAASHLEFTKGAPLEVLCRCRALLENGTAVELDDGRRGEMAAANDALARQGYRVLGVAFREGGKELVSLDAEEVEHDLVFLGLVAMFDPPRPEVTEAIGLCRQAGIAVTMLTGDYGLTAEAIGRRIGMFEGDGEIVSGEEFMHLSDGELQALIRGKSGLVFARMQPEQKLRLVKAYQAMGHVVAVTGDGVNDAPALHAAHIGIAMGKSGTDVAREAADVVLTDDNFATIVAAIEQGRAVYANIRKFITYILASNMAEAFPFIAMVVFKIPPALRIMQILAVDLGTDMVPALALGAEPPEQGIMAAPPRPKDKPLLDWRVLLRGYGFLGVLEGVACMIAFWSVWRLVGYSLADLQALTPAILNHTAPLPVMTVYALATTCAFATIVACQDGNLFACRSDRASILTLGFFGNPLLWPGILFGKLLLLAIIYIPFLARLFTTAPLPLGWWLALTGAPLLFLAFEEGRKWLVRSRETGRTL